MIGRTHDLIRDPLDRSWDAVVSALPATGPPAGQAEQALLHQFHGLDTAPGPDPRFVERLAVQLGAFEQAQIRVQSDAVAPRAPKPGPTPPTPIHPQGNRRRWALALAAALAMLLGGILVIWFAATENEMDEPVIPAAAVVQATPATPAGAFGAEGTLLSATFDPARVGATVQAESTISLEYVLRLESGEAFRQNGPESGDHGVSSLMVLRGTFDVQSSGPSLVYRQGELVEQDVAPNISLTLGEGDAWITSMQDLATAINTSGGPGKLLRVAFGIPGDGSYFEFSPISDYLFAQDPASPAWPDGSITIDVQAAPLSKGDTYNIDVRDDESYLLLTSGTGAVRISKDGTARGASTTATSLADYPPGAYTVTRDLEGDVEIYLARWKSAASGSSTGAPEEGTPATQTLLNATIDPAAIDAGSETNWNYSGVFPKAGLHPGQSIALDASNWGSGLTVTQVLDGTLTLVADGPAQIVRAAANAQEPVPAGTPLVLSAGDAVFYDGSLGAELRNDSETDASLLTFAAFAVPDQFFPDVAYPENLWGPLAPSVDLDLAQQFDGPVTVSFERTTLSQDQSIEVDVGENELVFFDTDDGSLVQFLQEGSDQPIPGGRILLHDKGPGTYTLTRLADDPVEVTIVRMRQADAASLAEIQGVTLANLTFDPALLGTDATQSWNMIQDFIVDLGPGETMSIGGEQFDGGFFVTFPLSGSVEVSTSRNALWSDHFGAGVQTIGPSDIKEIFPGQVWAGAAATPIEIANRTDQTTTLFVHSLGSTVSNVRGGFAVGSDRLSYVKTEAEDPGNNLVYDGEPVTVSIEQLTLGHGEEYEFALVTNETVLLTTDDGSPVIVTSNQDQVDTASNRRVLHGAATPQTYTITRDLRDPVEVYVIRVSAPNADEIETGAL
jgi:hypothetical protein